MRSLPMELGIAYGLEVVESPSVMDPAAVLMRPDLLQVRSNLVTFPSAPLYARAQPKSTGLFQPLDRRLCGRSSAGLSAESRYR